MAPSNSRSVRIAVVVVAFVAAVALVAEVVASAGDCTTVESNIYRVVFESAWSPQPLNL
jgi:hypothetical protein